ncbi:UNVERIFIED_CONTAM: Calmodulin binding protein PICBP [Sesamum radiatum]|uniref:Calmodulin binding protein PICBP n=1 Tax=Sesamum radiatum TaxID=300843 RepID=A0AAW2TJD8_SESRA
MIPETESRPGATQSSNKHKNRPKTQIVPIVETLDRGRIGDGSRFENENENGLEFYGEREAQLYGDGRDEILESGLLEVAFGETSFPERSYSENLDILRKYSSPEREFGGTYFLVNGYCLRCICQCHIKEQVWSKDEIPENENTDVSGISSSASTEDTANEASNTGCPETPVTPSERQRSIDCNGDEEGGITTESTSYGDSRGNEAAKVKDSETNSPSTGGGGKLRFSRRSHMSMWQLIHQHMSANLLAAESAEKQLQGLDGESPVDGSGSLHAKQNSTSGRELADSHKGTVKNDSEVQEIEDHKLFAIKLVREAIEKVLLPEVQDQASDDIQSITGKNAPGPELCETDQSEVCMQENFGETDAHREDSNVLSDLEEENHTTDDDSGQEVKGTDDCSGQGIKETDDASGQEITEVVSKSGKKVPKNWSNLKKWILLQRFIRELEKVTKFNARKPRPLALNPEPEPEPEAEKVNLRPQTVDGKKNAEEWMLDYALRQAVCQLAPTQKRKVALLVKGFEQVVPTQEEPQLQFRIPRVKSIGSDISSTSYKADHSVSDGHGRSKEEVPVNRTSTLYQETGARLTEKTEKLYDSNDNSSESSVMFQRSADERTGKLTSIMKSVHPSSEDENPRETAGVHVDANGNIKSESPESEKEEASLTTQSLILDGNGKSAVTEKTIGPASHPDSLQKNMVNETEKEAIPTTHLPTQSLILDVNGKSEATIGTIGPVFHPESLEKEMAEQTEKEAIPTAQGLREESTSNQMEGQTKNSGQSCTEMDTKKHIKMWHRIYQHVVSNIVERVGNQLLDGADDDEVEDSKSPAINTGECSNMQPTDDSSEKNHVPSNLSVTSEEGQNVLSEDGVLIDEEGQSWMHDSVSTQDETKSESKVSKESHAQPKAKNWGKLKKLILLKKCIKALEKARRLKPQPQEPENNETKRQMTDERRKAKQWMLDYAVQHIVTKLTPARKQRVSMLVEAFEAVIPFPEI